MGHMDQGFKALLDLSPAQAARFFLNDVQTEYLGILPTDVTMERQLIMDSLYRVQYQGEECALDIEVQAYADKSMPRRMYEYGVRANLAHGLPVLSVVVWLFKGEPVPKSPYQIRAGNRIRVTWEFDNIELYTLPVSAIINTEQIGLLPLVPFMQGATTEAVDAAMRRVREEAPAGQAEQLAALLGVFTTRFHGKALALDLVRRYFMSTEILQEFPLFRDMMAEAEAKGEIKGMREITLRLLENRFGALDQTFIDAINAAEAQALTELAIHSSAETLEQLRERLRRTEQGQ